MAGARVVRRRPSRVHAPTGPLGVEALQEYLQFAAPSARPFVTQVTHRAARRGGATGATFGAPRTPEERDLRPTLAVGRGVGHMPSIRRCGRVAEGGGLLNRYRVVKPYRGFESLRLRHPHQAALYFPNSAWRSAAGYSERPILLSFSSSTRILASRSAVRSEGSSPARNRR